MIEWDSFVFVAVVSLVAASVIVTIASFGIRLYESGVQAKKAKASGGRLALGSAKVLFGLCSIVVLFGVYLIVPAFH